MASQVEPIILASVCDFGWGSLGKLRLILDEIQGVKLALDNASGISATIRSMLGERHTFVDHQRETVSVALVINDPQAANALTNAGVPVIYVDSLPYLWTTPEEIPNSVSMYCAQKSPATLDAGSPLNDRPDLIWVEPIVPRARGRRGGTGIVINVGGLHSHLAGDSTDAYLQLAVMPLARLLAETSYPVAAICGNLPGWATGELQRLFPATTKIGPQPPHVFEYTLSRADTLITSPGSTTILQAAAIGLPTSLLPPQNLSQILNTEIYSSTSTISCAWPVGLLDRSHLDALRPSGEDAVLGYIYQQIIYASTDAHMIDAMTNLYSAMLHPFAAGGELSKNLGVLGFNGASQIARLIRQAIMAPLPRPHQAISG